MTEDWIGFIGSVIGLVIIGLLLGLLGYNIIQSEACSSYSSLTDIRTRYIKGTCYKYENNKLIEVKEI
jgi:hypothetical protein